MTWLWFALKFIGCLLAAGAIAVLALAIFFMLWIAYEQSQGRNPFA